MNAKTKTITMMGLLTALVVVLQLFVVIRFGIFALSTVLIPIVVGAALYGPMAGCWLGFVFGATVILSGDAAPFFALPGEKAISGTIITVLAKGIAAGGLAGLAYKLLIKKDVKLATIVSSAVAPIVNTGVFILGCMIFLEFDLKFILTTFIGVNFIIELLFNLILSSTVMFLIKMGRKQTNA